MRALTIVRAVLAVPALVVLGAGVLAQQATARPAAAKTAPARAPTAASRPTTTPERRAFSPLDPTRPPDPERRVSAVAVQGRYAYVGVGARLAVLDLADPARPAEVGRTAAFPAAVLTVVARGAHVYVGLEPRQDGAVPSGRGVRIVDTSDPARPREVGAYDRLRSGATFALWDRYLYAADLDRGLRVIDVADPARLVEVGRFGEGDPTWPVHASASAQVAAGDGRVYVHTQYPSRSGMRVLDVADPKRIAEVGPLGTSAYGMALADRTLALLGGLDDLVLVDVSGADPSSWRTGGHSFGRHEPGAPWPYGRLWWAGRHVYVMSWLQALKPYGSNLDVVDAGDPRKPVHLGRVDPAVAGGADGGAAAGRLLLLWGGSTLAVLDATDPVRPSPLGRFEF